LYEILQVDAAAATTSSVDKAGLRKAYYKTALLYHPDKNPDDTSAALKFQAVTAAYQILQDEEKRASYDETGEFSDLEEEDDNDNDPGKAGNPWKDYFDRIFGRVTVSGIDEFAQTYKCSDEEKSHVLQQYVSQKGNLVKMLEFVMLSTERDALRWVEDYIRPAIANQTISKAYSKTMEQTLKKITAKVEKEEKKNKERQTNSERSDNNNKE
jgi:DnaJ homolog subfamily C member 9